MSMTKEQKQVSEFYEKIGNKIKGRLVDIQDGPIVSNFIFEPDKDARFSTIQNYIKNENIMISAGGKNIIFQIPKETREMVLFKNLIGTKEFKETKAVLPILLGVDSFGETKIENLQKLPHILIAGRTGTGKSVFINSLLESLTLKLPSSECKFIIIDPKGVDYDYWDDNKYLMCPVTRLDVQEGFQKFEEILHLMDCRYQILHDANVRHITEYKEKTHKNDMPFIVVVIDELADFMTKSKKQTEYFVQEIGMKARAVGIHLIFATQRPEKNILSDTITANIPTRVVFQVRNKKDSDLALGESGAEKLSLRGDVLYSEAGRIPVRIHTPFIDASEVRMPKNNETKDLYEQAKEIVLRDKRSTISHLQRCLGIGYEKSEDLMKRMEEEGIVKDIGNRNFWVIFPRKKGI